MQKLFDPGRYINNEQDTHDIGLTVKPGVRNTTVTNSLESINAQVHNLEQAIIALELLLHPVIKQDIQETELQNVVITSLESPAVAKMIEINSTLKALTDKVNKLYSSIQI